MTEIATGSQRRDAQVCSGRIQVEQPYPEQVERDPVRVLGVHNSNLRVCRGTKHPCLPNLDGDPNAMALDTNMFRPVVHRTILQLIPLQNLTCTWLTIALEPERIRNIHGLLVMVIHRTMQTQPISTRNLEFTNSV